MMNILVTGGTGFIGRLLSSKLMKIANKLRVADRNVAPECIKDIEYCYGDFNDGEFCKSVVENIDLVIHLMGSGMGQELNPKRKESINFNDFYNSVQSTINVLNASIKSCTVKKFIQSSSSAIYGNSMIEANKNMIHPISPYGLAKYCQENISELYHNLFGMDIISLRFFNVYGFNTYANINQSNIVHKFIYLVHNNKPPIITGDLDVRRDYIYVEDVVDAISIMINELHGNHDIDIGTGHSYSYTELLHEINTVLGKDIKPIHLKRDYLTIEHSIADTSKMRSLAGYKCPITLKEGIDNIYRMMRK